MKKKSEKLTIVEDKVDNPAIEEALGQYKKFFGQFKREDFMIVVDYTRPSYEKRLFIYDLDKKEVIKSFHCAHGVNSSDPNNRAKAIEFSNQSGSHKSSLGAMVTDNVYRGQHGYSLRLDGLEKGKNDQVRRRCIVIHGADYCREDYIKDNKRAGQSHGCPAVSSDYSNEVVQNYKGGCFYYAYYK